MRSSRGVDQGGLAKIGLEKGDEMRINFAIACFFVSEEANISGFILAIGKFHFGGENDGGMKGMASTVEKSASGFHGEGAHPTCEAGAAVGGVNPKVGKVDGAGGGFGRGVNDGGVVANGGDLLEWIESEDHGVVEEGFSWVSSETVPAEAMLEHGQSFHFTALAEEFG